MSALGRVLSWAPCQKADRCGNSAEADMAEACSELEVTRLGVPTRGEYARPV